MLIVGWKNAESLKSCGHAVFQILPTGIVLWVPVSIDVWKVPIETEVTPGEKPLWTVNIEIFWKGIILGAIVLLNHIDHSPHSSVLLLIGWILFNPQTFANFLEYRHLSDGKVSCTCINMPGTFKNSLIVAFRLENYKFSKEEWKLFG